LRDPHGLSNNVFNYMLGPLGIKSIVDLGCGKGVSTTEFKNRGAKVLCVEGSHDAVTQSLLPPELVVEHDFSRGPWWPSETYDAVWCVEFLEHVGRPYMNNYLPVMKKAAVVFMTSSGWEGWHHVSAARHRPAPSANIALRS
jgi:2-polyprenyl-3-methyl-5-hydroxy-6-metoxy-1,4-benzoquinol methylase